MKPRSIAVVAAHPDDEVLGCGGTLAAHAAAGDKVHVLILAEGIASRTGARIAAEQARLHKAAAKACRILGFKTPELAGFPDNRMDSLDLLDVVQRVEAFFTAVKPQVIYTHHAGDLNIDHRIAHQVVVTATRPLPGSPVATLLFFETPSSTEWQTAAGGPVFAPNWFVDITRTLPKKLTALDAYVSELRAFPHPRSLEAVEHLARWRGASNGVAAAEAFMLGRHLEGTTRRK